MPFGRNGQKGAAFVDCVTGNGYTSIIAFARINETFFTGAFRAHCRAYLAKWASMRADRRRRSCARRTWDSARCARPQALLLRLLRQAEKRILNGQQ